MGRTQVRIWYNRFKKGRENINDDARLGRPSTATTDENIEEVMKIILDNRWITIKEFADDVGISFGSCQAIFMDVSGMKPETAKIVPKLLNFEEKKTNAWTSLIRCWRHSIIIEICLKMSCFGQKPPTKFTGLAPRWLLPLPKTEATDERKVVCYVWGDERKIETRAIGDTKKHV